VTPGRGLGHPVGLLHRDAAGEPRVQRREGERCPGSADRAQRGEVAGDEARLPGHRVEHGRDGEERVDPLLLDHLQRRGRVEPAHHDGAPAAQQRRVDRAVESTYMEQRRQRQRALVLREVEAEQLVHRVPRHVAVGEHRTLGPAGGAGRVHDQARVLERDRLVPLLRIGLGEQLLVGEGVGAALRRGFGRHPVPHARQAVPQRVGEPAELPAVDDDRRPRVGEDVLRLGRSQAGVDRHPDRTELPAGVEGLERRRVVATGPGHPVAGDHAEPGQRGGGAAHALGEAGVRGGRPLEPDGVPIGGDDQPPLRPGPQPGVTHRGRAGRRGATRGWRSPS
jgi:hypothetical protein